MAQNKTTYKKKQNKRNHKKYRGFTILLIGMVCFFTVTWNLYLNSYQGKSDETLSPDSNINNSFTHNTATANVTDNTGLLSSEQIQLLKDYAVIYAETLKNMEYQDVSHLYSDADSEHCVLNNTALKVLTAVRSMRQTDLTLEYASVEYMVEDVRQSAGKVTVTLTESNTQKFRHLSQPSLAANINHIFVLENVNDSWKIREHQHEEDFYLLTAEGWGDADGADNIRKGNKAYDLIFADASENLDDLSQFQQGEVLDLNVADTTYNRDKAVSYAEKWWNTRNYTDGYLAYDDFGGNCQNFASQCIHAGGIDMDCTGTHDVQWKFYDEKLNNRATATGRSYSWTGVDMFYSYALYNYKDGLVSLTDIPYSYAEKGDIVHVGAYYQWRHALLVSDVLKNDDGTLKEIVVASNTADRWNYPLSAYIYTAARLIHILGQN